MSKFINKVWSTQDDFLSEFDFIEVPRGGLDKYGAKGLEYLFKKIKKRKVRLGELGSWTGTSSVILGELARRSKGSLSCIDWFQGSEDSNLGSSKYVRIDQIFKENIKEAGLTGTVELYNNKSKEAYTFFPDNYFDMFFIDGDHRYDHIKEDIDLWYPKVKKGGILCGHDCEYLAKNDGDLFKAGQDIDYFQAHLGVIKAVCERFPKVKLTDKGYIWWIKKGNKDG